MLRLRYSTSENRPPDSATGNRTRRQRGFLLAGALGLLVLIATAACEPSLHLQRRMRHREESLRWTAHTWAKSEKARPARLARDLDYIPMSLKRSEASFEEMVERLGRLGKRDVDRWRDRQPVYREKAAKLLWGHPDAIAANAATLLY